MTMPPFPMILPTMGRGMNTSTGVTLPPDPLVDRDGIDIGLGCSSAGC